MPIMTHRSLGGLVTNGSAQKTTDDCGWRLFEDSTAVKGSGLSSAPVHKVADFDLGFETEHQQFLPPDFRRPIRSSYCEQLSVR